MKFVPFPILRTRRLLLRELTNDDADDVCFLKSDDIVNYYIDNHKSMTRSESISFILKLKKNAKEGSAVNWGLVIKGSKQIIGTICLWNFSKDEKIAEVGYALHPKFHKQSIMSEALEAIIDYGFSALNLELIEAFTHKENIGSKNLLEKHGFLHNASRIDEENANNIIYELSR